MLTNIDKAMDEFVTWIGKTDKKFQNDTEALNYFLVDSDLILLYLKDFKDLQFFALFLCHEKNYEIDLARLMDEKEFTRVKASFEQDVSSYPLILKFFEETEKKDVIKRKFDDFDDLISKYELSNSQSLFEIFKYNKELLKDYSYAMVFASYLRNKGKTIDLFNRDDFNSFKTPPIAIEKMCSISKGKEPEDLPVKGNEEIFADLESSAIKPSAPKKNHSKLSARARAKNNKFFEPQKVEKNIHQLISTAEVPEEVDEVELMALDLTDLSFPVSVTPSTFQFDTPDFVSQSPQSDIAYQFEVKKSFN